MDIEKKLSVCIPVYNGATYISQMLDTIISQSYDGIKIFVSDNKSTDNTVNIVDTYCREHSDFYLIKQDQNVGYHRNINSVVMQSDTDIVAIYHADDLYHETIVAKQKKILDENPLIAGVFARTQSFQSDSGLRKEVVGWSNEWADKLMGKVDGAIVGGYKEFAPAILKFGNFFSCPTFMTRKKIFTDLGGYRDYYLMSEDLDLWITYLKSGFQIAIINEVLMDYRLSDLHLSRNVRKSSDPPMRLKVIEDRLLLGKNRFSKKSLREYSRQKAISYLLAARNAYLQEEIKKMKFLVRESRKIQLIPELKSVLVQLFPITAFKVKDALDILRLRLNHRKKQ